MDLLIYFIGFFISFLISICILISFNKKRKLPIKLIHLFVVLIFSILSWVTIFLVGIFIIACLITLLIDKMDNTIIYKFKE